MSAHANPNIITDGLAFMYDTGDGKSYKGEPTSNIVPTPNANSRFTTSNNWQTYNTNQYNSNTYFSIGTVSSVSNNIVTLGSVGRNIRSFDVLKPETTGGGVTAGTNYVIKKISSTTFSLHEYNNSQNGSQGYINPDTGFHKVHDAYANDTRISINATNFPTSWWGGPHLPNSGLIKEIVEGGGRVSGTNAMRLHVYREDNVADGMAYGVHCPVTAGDVITISVYLKRADDRGSGKSLGYSTYFGGGYSGSSTSFGPLNTEWTRYQYTWTASNTYSFISYWWPNTTSSAYAIDMCDFQVEINGHATQFTTGTRSATEGLIDRTSNRAIDLSNVSFDSNAQIIFDGTDDTASVTSYSDIELVDNVSIEYVYKRLSTDPVLDVIANKYHGGFGWELFCTTANKFALAGRNGDGTYYSMSNGAYTIQNNQYYHLVAIKEGLSWKLYVNGELYADLTANSVGTWSNTGILQIGGEGNGYYPNMKLPILKIYNKALTSAEVRQNFNATKYRFGL